MPLEAYDSAVDRAHILAEIRRTAEENGGKAPGSQRFRTLTGIRPHEWQRYWARWRDALSEAGFEPNAWTPATDTDYVLERLALHVRERGRFPTIRERDLKRRGDPSFPSEGVFRRLGSQGTLARKLTDYCQERDGFDDVLDLISPHLNVAARPDDEDATGRGAAPEDGWVYLLRMGRHYKIGRTNAVGRREYELAIQLPERATLVHRIRTDDPPGIESYWHRRFADRRKGGEWFELSAADVRAFRRRKLM